MGAGSYLRSLRFQLTATYLLVFGLVFTGVVGVGLGVARSSVHRALDRELEDRARQMVAALVQTGDPFTDDALREAAAAESRTLFFRGFLVQVRGDDGAVIGRSEALSGRDLPLSEDGEAWAGDVPLLETVELAWTPGEPAEPYRVATLRHVSPGVRPFVVQVGSDLGPVREPVALMNRLAWAGLGVALLAAAAASWLAAGRAMARLGQIADAVSAVELDDLGEKPIVPPTPDPEVRRLADDLNRLLARIADGLRARERFIQDVSHELKTPLSVLHSEAQVIGLRTDLSEEARVFAGSVGEEARHLARLVESMLALARAEATSDMAGAAVASAYDAVVAAVGACQPAARSAGVSLQLVLGSSASESSDEADEADAADPDDALFFGDPELVTAMVSNLIRNAIAYSPAGEPVLIHARPDGEDITIAVEDHGPGIPPEAIGRIFDRFAQARPQDSARGHGLGLAIARTVAELHGGSLRVENRTPGGCRFTVTLRATKPDESTGSQPRTGVLTDFNPVFRAASQAGSMVSRVARSGAVWSALARAGRHRSDTNAVRGVGDEHSPGAQPAPQRKAPTMLKQTSLIAALALTPILGTSVVLAHGPSDAPLLQDDPAVAGGVVVGIDNEKSVFTLEVAPLEHVEVQWNDDTNFTLDGEPSTAEDVLVTDRMVSVEHHDGLAINVRGMLEEELPE